MKNIFIINGSASENSANEKLINQFVQLTKDDFEVTVFHTLKSLPHFDPQLSILNTPPSILDLRENIQHAGGIVICTPEYIFSIPAGLKNAIEWCVSTTVFTDKPLGIITASASGQKAHEEIQMIMRTVMTKFTDETTLLVQGVKAKFDKEGKIIDDKLKDDLIKFTEAFKELVNL